MLIGMVDVIFSDVAQPDQARIVTHNAGFFLKNNGWVMTLCCKCLGVAAGSVGFESQHTKTGVDFSKVFLTPAVQTPSLLQNLRHKYV